MPADTTVLTVALLVALVYGWPWWAVVVLGALLLVALGHGARRGES